MTKYTTLALAAAGLLAAPAFAANIAGTGTGLTGYTDDLATTGTVRDHIGGDVLGGGPRVNDGTTAEAVDTWAGSATLAFDWVQVTFAAPVDDITSVGLVMNAFGDGGWFGTNGSDALGADLVTPEVQVTSDGGTTWTTVASSSDYLTVMGSVSAGDGETGLSTFTFAEQDGINGIRLIGTAGGSASSGVAGFIGVREMEVNQVPEPGSLALMGLGSLALLRRRRA